MRYRLSDLIVVLAVVGVLSALAIPSTERISRRSKLNRCRVNLSQLMKAAYNYSASKCCEFFAQAPGGAFWEVLWTSGEIGHDYPDVLWCPALGAGQVGDTHFRGPATVPVFHEIYPRDKMFGVDHSDSHELDEPVNAVTVAAEAFTIERGTAEYQRSLSETLP